MSVTGTSEPAAERRQEPHRLPGAPSRRYAVLDVARAGHRSDRLWASTGLRPPVPFSSDSTASIDRLSDDVGVAGMPSGFLDHVQRQPADALMTDHVRQRTRSIEVRLIQSRFASSRTRWD